VQELEGLISMPPPAVAKPPAVTKYTAQFGRKRKESIDKFKKFQQKQTDLAQQLPAEHQGEVEVLILVSCPTARVHTVMTPGFQENPQMVAARDHRDRLAQYARNGAREATSLGLLCDPKVLPELRYWGEVGAAQPRVHGEFQKNQAAMKQYISSALQPKAEAAQEEARKARQAEAPGEDAATALEAVKAGGFAPHADNTCGDGCDSCRLLREAYGRPAGVTLLKNPAHHSNKALSILDSCFAELPEYRAAVEAVEASHAAPCSTPSEPPMAAPTASHESGTSQPRRHNPQVSTSQSRHRLAAGPDPSETSGHASSGAGAARAPPPAPVDFSQFVSARASANARLNHTAASGPARVASP